jgi:hypothetical protein
MRRLVLFAPAVLASVVACSPITVNTSFDPASNFARLRTFAWVEPIEGEDPAKDVAPDFRMRLRAAVEKVLANKGFIRAAEGVEPDCRIAYYRHLQPGAWITTWGYPYGPWRVDRWGYRYDPWLVGWRRVEVQHFEVGTLVLDIVDAKTSKLSWRGWGRGVLDPRRSGEQLLDAVRKVIGRFPPGR